MLVMAIQLDDADPDVALETDQLCAVTHSVGSD
jgi:hypothetical protein